MIFVAPPVFSQNLPGQPGKISLLQGIRSSTSRLNFHGKSTFEGTPVKQVISREFYTKQLGFFCKQEIKFEKATNIPFRFRLGSVAECDRMEGKGKRN
ncbi:MAG: hypothetical protein JWP81_3714 [Ferruginibacter sp.]|nr:hypothetical protein [Ferruginibacter sp.]